MRVLCTGAAGMIGRKLAARLAKVIFHLAAIVSGEAETDFDKGYAVNFAGTRALLEAIRQAGERYRPKVVFASSIAVFGAPFPEAIPDDFIHTPLTSYGTQKAMSELLLADYSRRGFLDGIGIRLPTIVVRPGRPNKAASSFFSSIVREPLAGQEAVLPVDEGVRHWFASPRAAVGFLVHAAEFDRDRLGPRINLTMPGVCCTVGEEMRRSRASPDRRSPRASAASPMPWWRESWPAGRRSSTPAAQRRLAFPPRRVSTTSSARISTTSWAGGSRHESPPLSSPGQAGR